MAPTNNKQKYFDKKQHIEIKNLNVVFAKVALELEF